MTTQEMIDAFLLEYDLNGSGAVAGFEDSEIVSFLNKAQKELVDFLFLNEGTSKIYNLVDSAALTLLLVSTDPPGSSYNSNIYSASLPSDYVYPITASLKLTKTKFPSILGATWRKVLFIDISDMEKFQDSSNNIILPDPVCYFTSNKVVTKVDSFTTVTTSAANLMLTYVAYPADLSESTPTAVSELAENLHQRVVDIAVNNALRVVNDSRIKQQPNT